MKTRFHRTLGSALLGVGLLYAGMSLDAGRVAAAGLSQESGTSSGAAPNTAATGSVSALQTNEVALAGRLNELEGARKQVEQDLKRLTAQVETLKRAAASPARDRDLGALLADSKVRASRLEGIAMQAQRVSAELRKNRIALGSALDVALASGRLTDAQRSSYVKARADVASRLTDDVHGIEVPGAGANADALDGPRELRQKADLLRDTEDKLRREVQRLAQRIDDADRRRRLRERAAQVDEDLFGENSSSRRVARYQANKSSDSNADRGVAAEAAPSNPTVSANSGAPAPTTGAGSGGNLGGAVGSDSGGSFAGGSGAVSAPNGARDTSNLRGLVDPATLEDLRRADVNADPELQTRALKKAQADLEALANDLHRRAEGMSRRADELRKQK